MKQRREEKAPRKLSGQGPSSPGCLNALFFQTEPTGLEATNLAKLCLNNLMFSITSW